MRDDKSWQGDQSTMRSDQNHTPDTVVVYPERLMKCGGNSYQTVPRSLPI